MKQGDHVKVMGIDGFYVFVKEVQGTATLRVGSANVPDKPTIAIATDRVVSLEKTK
jgi:membrane-bound lytic murein transglycosylase